MTMTRTDALHSLEQASEQIGHEWAKHHVGWIPDEVSTAVNEAVTRVIDQIKLNRTDWYDVPRKQKWGLGPSRDEIRAFLTGFTLDAARARRNALGFVPHISPAEEGKARFLRRPSDDEWHVQWEEAASRKRAREVEEAEAKRARKLQEKRERRRPARPIPQIYGVSHEGAERLVREWMRHLGVRDAEVTRFVADGGIDVDSKAFVAQVKNYTGSIPVEEVRALFGVAAAIQKRALLFTSGTLTREGQSFAEQVGIAAFQYDAVAGTLVGLNELGASAIVSTIPKALS